MPVSAQLGNVSYVLCAMIGAAFWPCGGIGGFTLGGAGQLPDASTRASTSPSPRSAMQLNFVVMALAGAERVFKLLDEEPEADEG